MKVSPPGEPGDADESQDKESGRKKSRKRKPEIKNSDLSGLKYFEELAPRFEPLHESGCERDKAGNRTLHYDQFCSLQTTVTLRHRDTWRSMLR